MVPGGATLLAVLEQRVEGRDGPGSAIAELHLDDELIAIRNIRARNDASGRGRLQVCVQVLFVGGLAMKQLPTAQFP
ncbi:MAG TPA: hypothetical protein PK593_08210, partial [Thermomicrobiales bacterium]|nr:hypothetical protein [Thermomicrobiales bacterium]